MNSNAYIDVEDILAHFKTVFANPNRQAEALTAKVGRAIKIKESLS